MQEEKNNVIEYLELSAGLGKTYTILKWVVEDRLPLKERWVYVGKSVELLEQSRKQTLEFDGSVLVDMLHYGNCKQVSKSVVELLESDSIPDMLFICHETLCNILKDGKEDIFTGWNFVIDEMLNVFSLFECRRDKEHDTLLPSMECLSEKLGIYTTIEGKLFRERMLKDSSYSSRDSKLVGLLKCISQGTPVQVTDVNKTTRLYTTYEIVPVRKFLSCVGRVLMLGARIKDTLHSRFIERQGITFKPFTDIVPSRKTYLNQERVSIYYLTSDKRRQGCTRTLIETAYSAKKGKEVLRKDYCRLPNGIDSLGGDYKLVYQEFVERACELLGDDFIYTVNYVPNSGGKEYRDVSVDGVPRGRSVPYACHGLNHLQDYTKAMCLFCYKPSNSNKGLLSFLSKVLKYPEIENDFVDEKYREASYQTCTRSRLRVYSDSVSEIIFVVPDKSVAEYIKKYHIQGCKIKDDLVLYIPDRRENNGGHNIGFAGVHFKGDSAGKKAYGRFKKAFIKDNGREPTEGESLLWLEKRKKKQEKR